MKHNQSVQSQSLQQKIYASKLRENLFKNTERWNTLIRTYSHYHWLFLFSLLFVFLGGSAIALYSLAHVETAQLKQPEPLRAKVVKAISTKKDAANPIPMWLVVAIAASCASGCLIVARFVNRRPVYRLKPKKHLSSDRSKTTLRQQKHEYKKLEPLVDKDLPVFKPSSLKKRTVKKVVKNRPPVTVIPPKPKFAPIQSQLPVAKMVNTPAKNPLPPLLRKS